MTGIKNRQSDFQRFYTDFIQQAGELFKNTGELFKKAGELFKNTGELFKKAGELFKKAGELFKKAGELFKKAGELFKKAGELFQKAGELFQKADKQESVLTVYRVLPADIIRDCHKRAWTKSGWLLAPAGQPPCNRRDAINRVSTTNFQHVYTKISINNEE
jgi:tetratricopeptide (TPR) repeat protein